MYFREYIINDHYRELHLTVCFLPVTTHLRGDTFPSLPLALVEFVNVCHNLERRCVSSP